MRVGGLDDLEQDIEDQEQLVDELEDELHGVEPDSDEEADLVAELNEAENHLRYLESCRRDYED